jgi:hypothetical protein
MGWIARAARWLLRRPAPETKVEPGPAIVRTAADAVGMTDSAGTAHGTWTIEGRIEWLEKRLSNLTADFEREREATSTAIAGVRGELDTERSEREAADRRTHGTLRDFAGSGLGIAVAGVLLFFLAAVLTGLPVRADHAVRAILGLVGSKNVILGLTRHDRSGEDPAPWRSRSCTVCSVA